MLNGFEVNFAGAGNGVVVGGGTIGISSLRFAGILGGFLASSLKSFCWALLAFCSAGVLGGSVIAGLISTGLGKTANGRRFKCGSNGFASTLAIKIPVTSVTTIPSAR